MLLHEAALAGVVAVAPAVQEHLHARVGPAAQLARIGRAVRERRLVLEIGHDEHGHARAAEQAAQAGEQHVDLCFEQRADIMDGREQAAGHEGAVTRFAAWRHHALEATAVPPRLTRAPARRTSPAMIERLATATFYWPRLT